jgi:AcrR family transcriptional regulator
MLSQRHIHLVPTLDPLLLAARASVLDLGLRRTTLAEVARRAGVSRMTAYRQYGDRDALVAALLTAELVGSMEAVTAAVADLPTARDRLVEAGAVLVAQIAHNAVYRRILDLDPELLLPLVVDRFGATQRAAVDAAAAQIRAGRRDGSVRRGPSAQAMAEHLVVVLQSFVFSARVLEARHPGVVTATEIRAVLTGYLS